MRPTQPLEAICLWTPAPAATMIPMAPASTCEGLTTAPTPGTLHWEAVPFIASKSGVPRRISASILLRHPTDCPYNKVTLSLYTDNCDLGPDTPLTSGIAIVPTAACDLAVARLRNAPALVQGVKYWVVATTNDQQAGLDATWYGSNAAQFGLSPGFELDTVQRCDARVFSAVGDTQQLTDNRIRVAAVIRALPARFGGMRSTADCLSE